MKARLAAALSLLLGTSAMVVTSASWAQEVRLPPGNWRQGDREEASSQYSSPHNFTLEFRFGGYSPEIDKFFGYVVDDGQLKRNTPYADYFGKGSKATGLGLQFYFGLELDYLALRIPYVGLIGPAFGWGFTTVSARAPFEAGADTRPQCWGDDTADNYPTSLCSEQHTSFTIMPMYVAAVVRADEIMKRTRIPIIPYAKLGFAIGYWRAASDGTTEKAVKGSETISGYGLVPGMFAALGGMLSLSFIDPRASARLDQATGVNRISLFGEWSRFLLNGIGSKAQLHVGASMWVVGLAIDM